MAKFQISVFFQSDVCSHEKFLFRLEFLFFIWIWGNAVRIGLSNAIDWNFGSQDRIPFRKKNNRNAITQSMGFLYIILYKSYPPEEQKMGWAAVLNHFTGWDYWEGI